MKLGVRSLALAIMVGSLLSVPVQADPVVIGVPVSGFGSTTQVSCPFGSDLAGGVCVSSNGTINFFIPITPGDSGTYPNSGTEYDVYDGSGSHPNVSSGYLDLFLYFPTSGEGIGSNADLTTLAIDLDLLGVNDPNQPGLVHKETIAFYTQDGTQIGYFDEVTDPGASGNYDNQKVVLNLGGTGIDPTEDFWLRVRMTATVDTDYKVKNTQESATFKVVSVPEAPTLTLLVVGLVGLGIFRSRFAV